MELADKDYDTFKVPIQQIWVDNDFNCRGDFTDESVRDLAGTIQAEGLMFPVDLQPADEYEATPAGFKFRLICGFRRTLACKLLGWPTIPARVRVGYSERRLQILNLMENLERTDLNLVEEARALDKLFGLHRTDQSISTELKKTLLWVRVRRKILTLPDFVIAAAASGRLSARDILAVIAHPTPERIAKDLIEAGLKKKKHHILYRGRQTKNKAEVKAMITLMLDEGFHPNILRLLGWAIGEVDDDSLREAMNWLRDRKGWLK